ncbi:MAG TPA: xanthine dehydrogenase family protein molybdopterin-binding subunit [Burkholderiales bacterium]|jgi:carbon-monoxide dehydrogenase large subunit|nr:xanthine dehydrogenase family protein molybdopterin-binding subunit [Burkholderiales bacterium]
MQPSRREDLRLIQGTGHYTADWNQPGQLYGYVLRSPEAHADIVSLNVEPALAYPGVVKVMTFADVEAAGFKSLIGGVAANVKGVGDSAMKKPFYPVLADKKVHYVGQAVAYVIAETAAIAQDASEAIEIEYSQLPAVVTLDDALAEGAPQLHAEVAGNLAFVYERGNAQAADEAFKRARYTSKIHLESQRLVVNPMEPRACLAVYHPDDDSYTLYSSSQGIVNMRNQVCTVTGIPHAKLEIIADDVGGSFGIRSTPYPEYMVSLLAAKQLGKPIKWVGTRTDSFLSDYHGRALELNGEIAIDENGKFLAFRWDDRVDLGGYAGGNGAFIGTNNLTITCGGVYDVPALYARTSLVFTNTTPISAYRGAGRPDIAFAIERLVDQACHDHNLDPVETRRKNFVTAAQMPYKTPLGTTYDCGDFAAVMDDALAQADWAGYPARRAASEKAGKLRGIGFATFLEASGGGNTPSDQTAARFDAKGDVTIYCAAGASGQGHETTFISLFAKELEITEDGIAYRASDSHMAVVGNGTGGSRTLLGQGSSFKLLAQKVLEKARPFAAEALGVPAESLTYAKGSFSAGGKSVGLRELAKKLASAAAHPFDCGAEGTFGVTFPNGCHVAEVEFDTVTGVAEIVAYAAVDDLGNVMQPTLVLGQVHGGVVQGAGQVFAEHAVYDRESGQFLSASFMDYTMPRADMVPLNMKWRGHPVPTKTNLLGAKGVGESGCSGSLPALMNAVMNALRPLGIANMQMPITAAKVWQALEGAKGKGAVRKAA